jgi:hypothetical protein
MPPRAVAAQAVKPPLVGLISMGDQKCLAWSADRTGVCTPDNSLGDVMKTSGVLNAVVLNFTWAQLQPKPGTTLPDATLDAALIDASLSAIAAYNTANPGRPIRAILRIETGGVAPDWVKELAGGSVSLTQRASIKTITVPRFWTDEYRIAWRALQAELAMRYDSNPLVAQISNTTCSHQSDEPYVNPTDSNSIIALVLYLSHFLTESRCPPFRKML